LKKEKSNELNKLWYTAPLTFGAAALLPEYIAPVLTVVCFVLVLKNRISNGIKPRFGAIGTAILAFMGWMVVSSFYSSYAISSLASIGLWVLMMTGFYFTSEVLDSEEKIQKTFFIGGLSAGIAGAIGIGEMLLFHYGNYIIKGLDRFFNPFWHFLDVGISKLVFLLPEFVRANMSRTTFNVFPARACSTFSNPLFFSAFEVMMLPFAAYCFLCMKEKKYRIIGLICFALAAGGVASSYSRGPYLYAAAVGVLLLLYGGKKALKLGGIGVGILAGVSVFASGTVKRILSLLNDKDISVNTRTEIWKAVWQIFKEHPIFGYGTGFNNVRQLLHNNFGIKQPHAHNIFFEIQLENGIPGTILFVALLFIFALNLLKLAKKGKEYRYYAVTLFASVSGFVLCGMTDCLFYGLKPLQYLMMIFGISQAVFALFLNDEQIYILPKSVRNKISEKAKIHIKK